MPRKVLATLAIVLFLIIAIPGAYFALAWHDTNPLELQLGHMTFQPDGSAELALTVRNRSFFPIQIESATLWHPTDHDRKPMHSFNMDSLPIVRHSLAPGQSLSLTGTTLSPEKLKEVDSFECSYVWTPVGRSALKRANDRLSDYWDDFPRYSDRMFGGDAIDNPHFVKPAREPGTSVGAVRER